MKKFSYEARDNKTKKIIKSDIQADTEVIAAKLLTEQGFTPLKITARDENGGPLGFLTNHHERPHFVYASAGNLDRCRIAARAISAHGDGTD